MGRIAGVEVINGSQWLPFRVLTGRGADMIIIDDPFRNRIAAVKPHYFDNVSRESRFRPKAVIRSGQHFGVA
jgi:hypothetical protein